MKKVWRCLLSLRRDDEGFVVMATLSIFLLLFVLCASIYAVGETARQKIRIQNACDAAAYSAAVVQADTLSRVATINRAMAWTYEQMTRRQLDYIVYRWLNHTVKHFEEDENKARSFHQCDGKCERGHKYSPLGWYIGSHDRMDNVQLNGFNSPHLTVMPMASETSAANLGSVVPISTVKSMLSAEGAKITASLLGSDVWAGEAGSLSAVAAQLAAEATFASKSNNDTLSSVRRMISEINGPNGEAVADDGAVLDHGARVDARAAHSVTSIAPTKSLP